MSFFEELEEEIVSTSNFNFRFESLDWVTRVWIKSMCDLIDKKLEKGEK